MQAKRITNLDALRGIAVILMVEQHLGAWLWKVPWQDTNQLVHDFPIFMGFNALGGLSAPLFVLLSGISVAMFSNKPGQKSGQLIQRGLVILFAGYLLNFMTPDWLSPGAWYVLQLIGTCLILAPLFIRMPTALLFVLATLLLGAAVYLQHLLDTPLEMGNARMSDTSLPGGVFRLALVEGHFPIFPWVGYHLAGIAIGRWIVKEQNKRIALLAIACGLIGLGLGAISSLFPSGMFHRATLSTSLFYPFMPPLFFMLLAASALCSWLMLLPGDTRFLKVTNPLVCLGRVSLTVFVLHIFLGKQVGTWLGFTKSFSMTGTFLIIALSLAAFLAIARLWHRYSYKFSLEWFMRKVSIPGFAS